MSYKGGHNETGIQMPELGSIGNRQAASLIGLAPFSRDSGKAQGARHIRGGRRRPRDTLYMGSDVCHPVEPGYEGGV